MQADGDECPLIVVMGVAGSGKSTIAGGLAERLGLPFIEGDALHPHANVAKMSAGIPLMDADRWPWLEAIGDTMEAQRKVNCGVIVSCSALKHVYRDCIRKRVQGPVRFILLNGPRDLISDRMSHRKGHFMPPALLESQFATLERPAADEDAVTLDISRPIPELVDEAVAAARAPHAHA